MRQYFEWGQSIVESYKQLGSTLHDYLPNLIGALAFLFMGWVCAIVVRFLILKLAHGFDKLLMGIGKQLGLAEIKPHHSIARITANTVYWIILLFFLGTILRGLGWPGLLLLIHDYLPRLLGSVVILLSAYLVSYFICSAIENYPGIKEKKYSRTLAKTTQFIIISFSVLMALEYLGLDMMLFKTLFLLIISFVLLGAALAFGIGARHAISHLLAMRNVKRFYKVGQFVKVDDTQGQIIDIQSHVIVLQTAQGKAIVPGDIFYDKITLLLDSIQHE